MAPFPSASAHDPHARSRQRHDSPHRRDAGRPLLRAGRLCPGGLGRRAAVAAGHVPLPRAPPLQADAAADERRDLPRHRPARRRGRRVHDQGVHRLLRPHARSPLRGSPRSDRRRRARAGLPGRGHRDGARRHPRGDRRGQRQPRRPRPRDVRRLLLEVASPRRAHPRHRGARSAPSGAETSTRYYASRYVPGNLIVALAGCVDPARALDAIAKAFSRRGRKGSPRMRKSRGDGAATPEAPFSCRSPPTRGPRPGPRLPRRRGALPDEPPALRRGAPRHRPGRRHVLPALPGSAREARPRVFDRLLAQRVSRSAATRRSRRRARRATFRA